MLDCICEGDYGKDCNPECKAYSCVEGLKEYNERATLEQEAEAYRYLNYWAQGHHIYEEPEFARHVMDLARKPASEIVAHGREVRGHSS